MALPMALPQVTLKQRGQVTATQGRGHPVADLITCSLALRCAQAWKRQKAALSEQGAQKLCHGSLRRQGGEWEVALLLGGSRGSCRDRPWQRQLDLSGIRGHRLGCQRRGPLGRGGKVPIQHHRDPSPKPPQGGILSEAVPRWVASGRRGLPPPPGPHRRLPSKLLAAQLLVTQTFPTSLLSSDT